jgi:D-alanyl-D-alanine carboxypeptidase
MIEKNNLYQVMKPRFYILFAFFTLLFLFYPGDSYYFRIFAYNRELIDKPDIEIEKKPFSFPYLRFNYYPFVTAEGIYVVDQSSFTPVMEKNPQQRFFPASTVKIITALVVMDIYKPDDVIVIKKTIDEAPIMGLIPGEKITVENLLYGMLVYSANDVAYVFADNYDSNKFVELMNKKAQQLKLTNTHFKNPMGFDDTNQYTTPFDLTLAGRALLENKYLAKIVSIKEITVSDVDYKYFHQLTNVNKLLGEIQGVGGLKTGHTDNAGDNLISLYKNNGHQFLIVVLKSQDRFIDTRNIIDWLNSNIDYYSVK